MGLLMSGFGLGAAGGVYAQDLPPIKIGEINTYSPASPFTESYRNGWQLAVDEINMAGGINGRALEVRVRDDGGRYAETSGAPGASSDFK